VLSGAPIQKCRRLRAAAGPVRAAVRLKRNAKQFIERQPSARLDYIGFLEPNTLAPISKVTEARTMPLPSLFGNTRPD